MFLARQSIIKLLASLSILWANAGHASVSERDAKSYFRFLSRINSASPLEHGGSHGALGFGLGMGFSVYHPAVSAQIMREHWRSPRQQGFENKASAQRLVLPKFYLYKGLPNALDMGLAVAQDVNTKARVWSGYGQWTPIEGFALPSIAIRGGFSRCMGLATTDASSLSLDGVLSYGFFKLFSIYGTVGISRHQIEVRSGEDFGTGLSLTRGGYGSVESRFVGHTRSVGMQWQILPSMAAATTEIQIATDSQLSFAAKLSLGM